MTWLVVKTNIIEKTHVNAICAYRHHAQIYSLHRGEGLCDYRNEKCTFNLVYELETQLQS